MNECADPPSPATVARRSPRTSLASPARAVPLQRARRTRRTAGRRRQRGVRRASSGRSAGDGSSREASSRRHPSLSPSPRACTRERRPPRDSPSALRSAACTPHCLLGGRAGGRRDPQTSRGIPPALPRESRLLASRARPAGADSTPHSPPHPTRGTWDTRTPSPSSRTRTQNTTDTLASWTASWRAESAQSSPLLCRCIADTSSSARDRGDCTADIPPCGTTLRNHLSRRTLLNDSLWAERISGSSWRNENDLSSASCSGSDAVRIVFHFISNTDAGERIAVYEEGTTTGASANRHPREPIEP